MPESPRYLSVRGDAAVAKDILVKFKIADRDMDNDLQLWANEHPKDKGFLSAFKEDFGVRYVIPVFGLFIFEQLIGAISILFYMQKILRLTGKRKKIQNEQLFSRTWKINRTFIIKTEINQIKCDCRW